MSQEQPGSPRKIKKIYYQYLRQKHSEFDIWQSADIENAAVVELNETEYKYSSRILMTNLHDLRRSYDCDSCGAEQHDPTNNICEDAQNFG